MATVAERILGGAVTEQVWANPYTALTEHQLLEARRQAVTVLTWFEDALSHTDELRVEVELETVVRKRTRELHLIEAGLAAQGVG